MQRIWARNREEREISTKELLSELSRKVQKSMDETKKSCNELVNSGLIELVGKEYMLTVEVYEVLKSDVEYTRDKTVQYIRPIYSHYRTLL